MAPMQGMTPMTGMAPMQAWWPPELGTPSSTGAQNTLRYAIFPAARRLAIDCEGQVSVHDTGDLPISGCTWSDDQKEVRFSTSDGRSLTLSNLAEARPAPSAPSPLPPEPPEPQVAAPSQSAVLEALAKLGELKEMGVLTAEEFAAKKAELLQRL
jgi:hypothetical protein